MPELVRYDVDSASSIATVSLNRPEKLNALNVELIGQVRSCLDDAERDPQVRVVLLRGEGRVFCAGQDMGVIQAPGVRPTAGADGRVATLIGGGSIASRLTRFTKPTVAAIHGTAVGAGLDVALACDFRIAEASARMSDWHVRRGLIPSAGIYFLPRYVGVTKALELLALGTVIQGEEAARLGLVNRSVPDGQAHAAAFALADEIARGPQIAIQHIKRLIWKLERTSFDEGMELVNYARGVGAVAKEGIEGIAAHREQRDPDWRAAAHSVTQ